MTDDPRREKPGATSFFDHDPSALAELMAGWGEPAFRGRQVFEWVFAHGVTSYEQMTNLPKALRGKLADAVPLYASTVIRTQTASDRTVKLLLAWPDGARSECVLIPDAERRTACVSTQVGCPVGCVFCASGLDGLQRQLTAGEIVEQAMRVRELCGDDERLSNVVLMGLGEPLANYDATVRAVRAINDAWGMGIGARKITVSTVGLPKQMRMLADEGLQITLALSLHAPTDELRRQIIPWAQRVEIESLVEASNYFFERTGREVTLEYILLGRLNDAPEHARQLATVSKRMRSNVNLLLYNPVEGLPYARPADAAAEKFLSILTERGVNAHVRRSRGLDIDAACGQLRRREARQRGGPSKGGAV